MGNLQTLARRVGADERTLRRAVEQGAVRASRPSPRRLDVAREETRYLTRHWSLLAALRQAFRTERSVRLAVLFGSLARGDASADSDVDLLVARRDRDPLGYAALSARLERVAGRRIHIVPLEGTPASPSLLADALEDGRVLIDRDHRWPDLTSRSEEVHSAAREVDERTAKRATEAVSEARSRLG
jgi:predicted nucleotidyltransferase